MFNPWLELAFQAAKVGLETQNVIALRLLRLAGGGVPGLTEARLMVTDKVAALAEVQVAAAPAALPGNSHKTAKKVLNVLEKRIRANKNRLAKRGKSARPAR